MGLSDRTPLLIDSGDVTHIGNKNIFSFEPALFEREGFLDLIAREWTKENRGESKVERWQYEIRNL